MNLRLPDRVPLSKLQIIEEIPSPLKRKAKIQTRRLPEDFFSCSKRSQCQTSRNEIQTQSFPRRVSQLERHSETRQTSLRGGNLSARIRDEE